MSRNIEVKKVLKANKMIKIHINKNIFLLILIFTSLISINISFAKDKEVPKPTCSSVGDLQCPKGFKPTCPEQHKPSCVFAGTMQLPACLADSADNTFYSYKLDKIICKKSK